MFNTQLRSQLVDLLTDVDALIAESVVRLNAKYPGQKTEPTMDEIFADAAGNDGLCSSEACRTCQSPTCTGNEKYRQEWDRFEAQNERLDSPDTNPDRGYQAYLADPTFVLDPRR